MIFVGVVGEGKCESGFGRLKSKLECWQPGCEFRSQSLMHLASSTRFGVLFDH